MRQDTAAGTLLAAAVGIVRIAIPFGHRRRRRLALLAALAVTAAAVQAAPADEHRRGLQALHRGDVAGAIVALRPAAAAGHAPSQSLLAQVFEGADEVTEAARLFQAAAQQDDAEGHVGLARLLLVGRGLAKDEKRALQHFSKAAALGHAHAAEVLASAYLQRRHGADESAEPAAAREAVLRAAAAGHLPSVDALALAYRDGRFGLAPDEAQAARWRNQAAAWRLQRASAASAPAPGPARR